MAKAGQPVDQLPRAGEVWLDNDDGDGDDCSFHPGGCRGACGPIAAVLGHLSPQPGGRYREHWVSPARA